MTKDLDDIPDAHIPEASAADPTTATEDELAQARRERDEHYDRLLRQTAEFDNYRKRIERERKDLAESAGADLLAELLPILDDLERALRVEVPNDAAGAYRAGVEIIHGQLLELLRKRGVRRIEAVGNPFDPHFHQAVAHEISAVHPEGEVMAEFRTGYMLGNRLLRPAMVKVAKA